MNYFDFNKSLISIQFEVDLVKVNEKTSGLYDLNIEERHFDKGELSGGIGDGMGKWKDGRWLWKWVLVSGIIGCG